MSDHWWFSVKENCEVEEKSKVLSLRLSSKEEERTVCNVTSFSSSVLLVTTRSEEGHLYSTKLSTAAFVPVDSKFRVVRNAESKPMIERLKAVMTAYDVEFGSETVQAEPASSTPKLKSAADHYTCNFTFREQVEIMRSLHESPSDGFLNTANPLWQRRSLRAMKLEDTQRVYFGGKFREAIAVSCLPTSCYNIVQDLFNKFHVMGAPELLNSGLFKEVCGFKDEERLKSHLTALLEGSLTRKDFVKSLQADKKRAKEAISDEVVVNLRLQLSKVQEEKLELEKRNEELEEKLRNCRCDVFEFRDSPVRPRHSFSLPQISSDEESLSTEYATDLSGDLFGRSPSPLRQDSDGDLNKKFVKKKGPLQLFAEKVTDTVKRKASQLRSDATSQQSSDSKKRRMKKEMYTVGEEIEALWVDKKPQLTEWYAAEIQSIIVSGESYRVRFLDDNIIKVVKVSHLRKL